MFVSLLVLCAAGQSELDSWTAKLEFSDGSCSDPTTFTIFPPNVCLEFAGNTQFGACSGTQTTIATFGDNTCSSDPIAGPTPFPVTGSCSPDPSSDGTSEQYWCYGLAPAESNPFEYTPGNIEYGAGTVIFANSDCEEPVAIMAFVQDACVPGLIPGTYAQFYADPSAGNSAVRVFGDASCSGPAILDSPVLDVAESCSMVPGYGYVDFSPEWPPACPEGCRFTGSAPSSRRSRRLLFGSFSPTIRRMRCSDYSFFCTEA